MITRKAKLLLLAAIAVLVALYALFVDTARLPPMTGSVRDARTGRAVDGAIVFGIRRVTERQHGNLHGVERTRCVVVDTAIVDASARFEFPSRRITTPSGWEFESASTQYHVVARGYQPSIMDADFDVEGEPLPATRTQEVRDVEIVLQPANASLMITPLLADIVHACSKTRADLAPAIDGFERLFALADLETDDFDQRQWLNRVGIVAVNTRFPGRLAQMREALTNEQIRDLLVADEEVAIKRIALRDAIIADDVGRVRDMLENGADLNAPDGYRRSLRWLALDNGAHESYRLLRDANAQWRAGEAEEVLYVLARRNDVEGVRLLVDEGVRGDVSVPHGHSSALLAASREGYVDVLRHLLEGGADPDARPGDHAETALQLAFQRNEFGAFLLLLQHGADPDVKDRNGHTLLSQTVRSRSDYGIALLEHGAKIEINTLGDSLLAGAIHAGNRSLADAMLKAGFTPGGMTRRSPLAAAVSRGWQDMVTAMLRHPDARPGSEPWWHGVAVASTRSDQSMLTLLLAQHDKPLATPPPRYGCIACFAVGYDRRENLQFLIAHGVPVDGRNAEGDTALMLAARYGRPEIAQLLLAAGASAGLSNEKGSTALAFAADAGAKEYAMKRSGIVTPTQSASTTSVPMVTTVRPADIEDRPSHERPPQPMRMTVFPAPASLAAVASTQPNAPPVSIDVLKILLMHGVDVDAADIDGWTPLMRAAARGNVGAVELLLRHGARSALKNLEGRTAAQIAAEAGFRDLARRLH